MKGMKIDYSVLYVELGLARMTVARNETLSKHKLEIFLDLGCAFLLYGVVSTYRNQIKIKILSLFVFGSRVNVYVLPHFLFSAIPRQIRFPHSLETSSFCSFRHFVTIIFTDAYVCDSL